MDNPLCPDKTEQAEIMNSSENKDDICNNEEVSVPQEKRLDEIQLDKDTEEVCDKTIQETATITSSKDLIPSNVEASDSVTCLTTTSENDNTEAKISSKENNDTVTIKEINVAKSSYKENASVNINKDITKLSVPNLTEKCDVEHLSNKNSCEVTTQDPDHVKSDSTKSASENITNVQLEISSTESKSLSKDCDVPDESSVNADDVQISRKDIDSSKKVESESSDSNSENPDKDLSEKNVEPENTEFVQFSHDKHDDSQIENQSVDAVDPFGGDNLASENVEQMETDSFAEDEVSFKNLYDQRDSLQHANVHVNIRSNEHSEKLNIDCTLSDPKDVNKDMDSTEVSNDTQTNVDSLESTSINTDIADNSNIETEAANTSSTKLSDEQNKQTKKNITEEITSMETDEEQTDVLPGQDDELCIIPDSMKVIIPNKPGKAVDSEQNGSTFENGSKRNDETTQKSSSGLDKSVQDELEAVTENKNNDSEKSATTRNEYSLTTEESKVKAADVINIDDESKNSEVEEITNKEICKQCGEDKACKIRVKIGAENYHVCSKTCKALFKAANNKAVDIPSDGPSSKCEKRCATCLSVIETNDERNLSWETMEFCNEECLGKFQRKYGSYCKNCNGIVQAVSLGKYCVRFGCDVRQFCCSTCLEEFKKGLKVCSYCQKDISFSTDGFLAPVGEKGQFKDFCTQDCMEKYSKLNSTEPPATEKKLCSVCKQV